MSPSSDEAVLGWLSMTFAARLHMAEMVVVRLPVAEMVAVRYVHAVEQFSPHSAQAEQLLRPGNAQVA